MEGHSKEKSVSIGTSRNVFFTVPDVRNAPIKKEIYYVMQMDEKINNNLASELSKKCMRT